MVPAPLTNQEIRAVVIGASAGAVDALGKLLPALPADLRIPLIVVVHLPPTKPSLLPEIFSARCAAPVRQPFDKQPIEPGIWMAPPDYHLLIEEGGAFAVSLDEPVHYSRPSIDVLFESAAAVYGATLAAVVLTGASRDGANGARAVKANGGLVLVQDPASAEVDVMPRAAIEASSPHLVAPLDQLTKTLCQIAMGTEREGSSSPRRNEKSTQ
jgi:two-component system chemotaxis response regulator CheB